MDIRIVNCSIVKLTCINSVLDRSNSPSPEDNEHAQIMLYDNVNAAKEEPDVTETSADNPQYEDTLKQSDATANPKPNENVYSYAVP